MTPSPSPTPDPGVSERTKRIRENQQQGTGEVSAIMVSRTPEYERPPVFDPERNCPKCGSGDVGAAFHPATNCTSCNECHTLHKCEGGKFDHLVRHCRFCSYEWYELPLDAVAPS